MSGLDEAGAVFDALAVIVLDPAIGRWLRSHDPKAFSQAVTAYWRALNAEDGGVAFKQDGFSCPGCSGDLREDLQLKREWGKVPLGVYPMTCPKCNGLVNTGFGDHIPEKDYQAMFAGLATLGMPPPPPPDQWFYFDLTTVDDDGAVRRHHGYYWRDPQTLYRWIAQMG